MRERMDRRIILRGTWRCFCRNHLAGSRDDSIRAGGAASIAASNGEGSIAALLSDGNAASGVCHWNASRRPVTGDTGRQRSLT